MADDRCPSVTTSSSSNIGEFIEVETEPSVFIKFRIVLPRARASRIKSGEHA